MTPKTGLRAALALTLLTSTASAQIWTEDFTAGSNDGGWEVWWNAYNAIELSGGNPGSYLRLDNLNGSATCQFVEVFPTVWPAGFTGDWRALGVDSIGLDVRVDVGPFTGMGDWTVTIGNDNGTTSTNTDDCTLEFTFSSLTPPMTAGVWESFDFDVPTDSTTVPPGWIVSGPCVGGVDAVWNQVIQDVDYVRFRMDYDPSAFCIFWNWDMGVDNLRLESTTLATPYCAGDGTATACICGNLGGPGEGCRNSSGSGALLVASGSASVASDDLAFDVTQGPAGVPGIVFLGAAQANGGAGTLFGDGLLCASGAIQRLGVVFLDGGGAGSWGPNLAAMGGYGAGDTRHFQGWFRDVAGPCGQGFNTTQALSVAFLP